ncbi:MAG: hypothetical protein R2873_34205 [Caldilineaceae bacterium]
MAQILELTLNRINAAGDAVGEHPDDKRPIIVADAIPGECVEIEIEDAQIADPARSPLLGTLRCVVEASPARVTPPCPYFGPPQPVTLPDGSVLNPDGAMRCAGCAWQHIAYDEQLNLKRQMVVETLVDAAVFKGAVRHQREAAERMVYDVVGLGDPNVEDNEDDLPLTYGYLTQMTFRLNGRGECCLPSRSGDPGSPALLPVEFCPLHHPQLADLFSAFAVDAESGSDLARDLIGIEMSVGGNADVVDAEHKGVVVLESRSGDAPDLELDLPVNVLLRRPKAGDLDAVEVLVGDWAYTVNWNDAQMVAYPAMGNAPLVSPHLLGDEAIGALAGSLLELQPFEHVIHLWAGAGIVSRGIAEGAATVIAVEEGKLALAALEANIAGADNVALHRGPVRRVLDQLRRGEYETNVALLTPGANPVDDAVFRHLDRLGILRAAVVVEDITTLGELIVQARAARFELIGIQPVDLQPQQDAVTVIVRVDRVR